jgi:hypothetical protein
MQTQIRFRSVILLILKLRRVPVESRNNFFWVLGKCVLHVVEFVAYKICLNNWSMLQILHSPGQLFDLSETVSSWLRKDVCRLTVWRRQWENVCKCIMIEVIMLIIWVTVRDQEYWLKTIYKGTREKKFTYDSLQPSNLLNYENVGLGWWEIKIWRRELKVAF